MAHSSIGLPPDGAGKKLHTHIYTVGEDTVHNQVMILGTPDAANFQQVDDEGAAYVKFAEGSQLFDGFGKTKVSNENYLGTYSHKDGKHTDSWLYYPTAPAGDVSCEFNATQHCMVLSTGTAASELAFMQTHMYHRYKAGTSNLFLGTVVIGDTGKTNVVRRWGLFDSNDGLFFELNGTDLRFVVRSNTTGTPVDTAFSSANWQEDKLDGTGLSGMAVDLSKDNIFWFDYQYLGAGRVRFGIYDEQGRRRVCGHIEHANTLSHSYMAKGDLPYRIEQVNADTAASISQMKFFLGAVIAEGSSPYEQASFFGYEQVKTVTTGDGEVPLLTVRPKLVMDSGSENFRILVPWLVTNYNEGSAVIKLRVYWGNIPTTGATWTAFDNAGSGFDVDTTATEWVNTYGRFIKASVISPNECCHKDYSDALDMNKGQLMLDAGKAQVLTFMITAEVLTAAETADIHTSLSWKEY